MQNGSTDSWFEMGKEPITNMIPIEVARISDAEAIVHLFIEAAIWLNSRGIYQWPTTPQPTFREHIGKKIGEGEVSVVRGDNGHLLAHIRFDYEAGKVWHDNPAKSAYVRGLVIANEIRGQGMGAALLDWAQGYAREHSCTRLRLDCLAENVRLCQYYTDYGFTFLGKGGDSRYAAALFEMMLSG
jgi:GNAT superfamily N-acetyltransferase